MTHPDEETLELLALDSDEIADQRPAIQAHLKGCPGCSALLKEIEGYYAEVRTVHEERSKAVSQALTVKSLSLQVPPYTEFGPLSQMPKTLPARIILFAIRHPSAATTGFAGLVAGIVLAALTLFSPTTAKDRNPSYARAKDEFLVVYNKEGDVLWRKHIGIGYDTELLAREDGLKLQRYLEVIDVDGDGKREILALFLGSDSLQREIHCFNPDGTQRWAFHFRRDMTFGTEDFSGEYRFLQIMVGDYENKGKPEVIAVATYPDYYPTVILKVDASTGQLVNEYWSSGNISTMAHRDFDGDGIDELYLAGGNNGSDRAFLLVLDPREISGRTPSTASHTPRGIAEGTEKFYIEFPRSDLERIASQKRNVSREMRFLTDSSLSVAVGELVDTRYYLEFYHFNNRMACTFVDWQDETMALYRRLAGEGRLPRVPDAAYYENLRNSVLYWDGEKFVNTPTVNRRYLEALPLTAGSTPPRPER